MNDPNENQTPSSESAPSDQGASETVDSPQGEVSEQQPVDGNESTESGEQQTSPSDKPEQEEDVQSDEQIPDWDGNNVEDLPKPLQKRAKDMLRHMHKVSQEAAQVKKYADAYQQVVNHPEFKEFLDWKDKQLNSQQQAPQENPQLTEEEFLAAQSDPQKYQNFLAKNIQQSLQPYVETFQKFMQQQQHKDALEQGNRMLDDYASKNPDFWDINPVIMKAAIQDKVINSGGTLADAHTFAKQLEKQYLDKAKSSIKDEVEKKKKAISNTPTKSAIPSIIYVKDREEAKRVAFENAVLGKKVDVRIKR